MSLVSARNALCREMIEPVESSFFIWYNPRRNHAHFALQDKSNVYVHFYNNHENCIGFIPLLIVKLLYFDLKCILFSESTFSIHFRIKQLQEYFSSTMSQLQKVLSEVHEFFIIILLSFENDELLTFLRLLYQ